MAEFEYVLAIEIKFRFFFTAETTLKKQCRTFFIRADLR